MAAGEGRRLRPLSERYAKPVLPIDGRPVVVGVLRDLAEAGIERAWVVTGHLAEQVERLLAGGREAFGLEVRFVHQPRPDGSADTVRRALAAGGEPPLLVVAADTRFSPGDVARFAAAAEGFDGAIAGRSDPPPGPGRPPLELADGRVVRVLGDQAPERLSGAPLWGSRRPSRPAWTRSRDRPTNSLRCSSGASIGGSRLPGSRSGRRAT